MPTPTRAELKRRRARVTVLPDDQARRARPRDGIRLDGRRLSMKLGRRLIGARREPGLDATTVSFDVFDDDGTVLSSGLLGRRVMDRVAVITVDGLDYVVSGVSQGDAAVTIEGEPAEVRRLKRHGRDKPVRASRNDITCAAFCAGLIRDAGERVIVLDEDVAQSIAGQKKLRRELRKARREVRRDADDENGKRRVTGVSGASLTVKGVAASQVQRRVIAGVIGECRRLRASTAVTVAAVCCVIQESVAGKETQQTGNDDTGLFQQGRNWIDVADVNDPAKATRAFLTGAINGGGAPGWRQIHGSLRQVPGGLEAATKRVQVSVGGYQQWAEEARRWVDAAGGADFDAGGDGAAWIKQYTFERKRGESTWACAYRLLVEERGWALFSREGVIVIASELALARAEPSLTLNDRNALVDRPTFDWHLGLPVGEATARAILDRYTADPGEVADVRGLPQLQNGTGWLIASAPVDLLNPDTPVEIALRLPREPKPEPSSEVGQRSGTELSENADARLQRAYSKAGAIDERDYAYAWGGGHANFDGPYDCSGAVSAVLHAADLLDTPMATGGLIGWGKPGRGKAMTVWVKENGNARQSHCFITFQVNGRTRFFEAGGNDSAHTGWHDARSTAGFEPRHWPGL